MAYRYPVPTADDLSVLLPHQIENLRKLRDKLHTVPDDQFDMSDYFTSDSKGWSIEPTAISEADYSPECGTVACACGWGPAAGVAAEKGENWNRYAVRAFGANSGYEDGGSEQLYNYLFDQDQGGTARMAARRIETVLRRLNADGK